MNMQSSIDAKQAVSFETRSSQSDQLRKAHIFRSKVIGKCADVECWLVDRIRNYQTPASSLTEKTKQLSAILKTHKKDFQKPEELQKYLDAYRPFATFRSEIAHAKLSLFLGKKGEYFAAFQNAQTGSDLMTAKSISLSEAMQKQIWDDMCLAAGNLTNYKTTPPSSPPRQTPDAATGP